MRARSGPPTVERNIVADVPNATQTWPPDAGIRGLERFSAPLWHATGTLHVDESLTGGQTRPCKMKSPVKSLPN